MQAAKKGDIDVRVSNTIWAALEGARLRDYCVTGLRMATWRMARSSEGKGHW